MRLKPPIRLARGGFILLESLLALVILTGSSYTLLRYQLMTLQQQQKIAWQRQAEWLAWQSLEAATCHACNPIETPPVPDTAWRRSWQISPASPTPCRQLLVKISGPEGTEVQRERVCCLRFFHPNEVP